MSKVISFDTETLLFSPENMAPTVVCGTVAQRLEGASGIYKAISHNSLFGTKAKGLFEYCLADRAILVGHNTAYDLACIANTWPELFPLIWELYDNELVSDTIVRQKLSDLARGRYRGFTTDSGVFVPLKYDLASVYHRHTGKYLAKEDTWRLRYSELLPVPLEQWPQDAIDYAVGDAVATLEVYEGQAKAALEHPEGPWFFVDEAAQCRADWWLHLTSVRGVYTDPEQLDALREAAQAEIALLEGVLSEPHKAEDGTVFAPLVEISYQKHRDGTTTRKATKKKKAVQARVLHSCNEQGRPPRYTDTGKAVAKATKKGEVLVDKRGKAKSQDMNDYIVTDRDACLETGDPLLLAYTDYSSALKTLSTDIKAYEQGVEFPIHTRFESLAATGRTTSSGPNIQNVRWNFPERCDDCRSRNVKAGHICGACGGRTSHPPGIRECFIPRPGHVILAADYDQLELRALAQVCLAVLGESRLAQILNSGGDPHMAVAAELLGLPLDYCLAHKKEDRIKLARQTGKVANFGFPGGLGAEKLVLFARMAYGVRITEDDARDLKRTWLDTYPEFRRYFKHIDSLEQPDGTFAVEHIESRRLRSGCFYCVACNSYFQGLGADATKAAGYLISRACYYDQNSPLYGCGIINYIHDEFLVEVPIDADGGFVRANQAAKALTDLMSLGAARYFPDVPATATPLLMTRWSKSAETKKDVDGQLIPWER